MDGHRDEEITGEKNGIWKYAARQAVRNGNWSAMMQCWKRLNKYTRKSIREIILHSALQSLQKWKSIHYRDKWREILVSNLPHEELKAARDFNLPSYYSELLGFFLSKMCETQLLGFFKIAFEHWGIHYNPPSISILECFLEWPLRDCFLPLINSCWTVIPKFEYGEFLLIVAIIYNGSLQEESTDPKEENHYDYRSLLLNLWENAPEDFRQFCVEYNSLIYNRLGYETTTIVSRLLFELSRRHPLIEDDYKLFKRVLHDVPQVERMKLMLGSSLDICSNLIDNNNSRPFAFVDWLLEQCLPDEEICSFRKQLIESNEFSCFFHLHCNNEKFLENFIDWAFTSDTDKIQFKQMLIEKYSWVSYVVKGDFNTVERVMNFCLSSDMKEQFKKKVVIESCYRLLRNCAWQKMDKCLAWGADTEEKIKNFKQDIFNSHFVELCNIHYDLVFVKKHWESVKDLYNWFNLSTEEIIETKKSTVFTAKVIEEVHTSLYEDGNTETLIESLRWCLTNEGMVISFKEEIEKEYFQKRKLHKIFKDARKRLDYLVNRLLCDLKKTTCEKQNDIEASVKDGQENSLVVEDESVSQRKRFKKK